MKLILEDNFEGLDYVTELNESTGEKTYVVKGTFSTPEKKNRNGRIYGRRLWEENVQRYQDEIKNNTVNTLMEAEHPPRSTVDMWQAVGKIRKLEMRDGVVYGEAVILNNNKPESNQLKSLIDAGIKIGVSTRGVGRLGKNNIVEEYKLITVDFVSSPSDLGANLNGFNESMILEDKEFSITEDGKIICDETGCKLEEGAGVTQTETKCSKAAKELLESLKEYTKEEKELTEAEKKARKLLEKKYGRRFIKKQFEKAIDELDEAIYMIGTEDTEMAQRMTQLSMNLVDLFDETGI